MFFTTESTSKIKVILLIVLSGTKAAHAMQAARDRVRAYAEMEAARAEAMSAINQEATVRPASGTGIKTLSKTEFKPITLIDAAAIHAEDRFSRMLKSQMASFLLRRAHFVIPVPQAPIIPVLTVRTEKEVEVAEEKARQEAEAETILQKFSLRSLSTNQKLNEQGQAEMAVLSAANFHDLMIRQHLVAFIPALMTYHSLEDLKKIQRNLYEISRQPDFVAYKADISPRVADIERIAVVSEQNLFGLTRRQIIGNPSVREESFVPDHYTIVAEKYASGRINFILNENYLQAIRSLSPQQINFIIDLYRLGSDQVNRRLVSRMPNGIVQLSKEQADILISLPSYIKLNLLKNYPIGIHINYLVNAKSKEFLRALRDFEPITQPLTQQQLAEEDQSNEDVLTKEEVAMITELTFEQRELIRDMYHIRGTQATIVSGMDAFIRLDKAMQKRLLRNYPLIKTDNMEWAISMVLKHPGKAKTAVALLGVAAGGGIVYAYGAKAAAVAVPVIKNITFKKVRRTFYATTITAVGAAWARFKLRRSRA